MSPATLPEFEPKTFPAAAIAVSLGLVNRFWKSFSPKVRMLFSPSVSFCLHGHVMVYPTNRVEEVLGV